MGAQGSTPSLPLVPKRNSRGDEVIPWGVAKEMEKAGRERIAELQAQLEETRDKLELKEDELSQTQRRLAKLEGDWEKHAQDSELEQTRLSRMEETLAQERAGTEEKIGKFILAVAGEKRRAELAERARDEAAERASAECRATIQRLEAQLEEEEGRRRSADALVRERGERLAELGGGAREGAEARLAAAEAAKEEAERRAAEGERRLAQLQRQGTAERSPTGDTATEEMVRELQQQVAEEMGRRMEVQQRLLEKDRKLREVQEAPPEGPAAGAAQRLMLQAQQRLAQEEKKRLDAEEQVLAKETELRQLQQQLADELKNRRVAMEQVAEKEAKLGKLRLAMEGDDLTKQHALQGQVIEKEREVCELQQQLADELSKRQAVQYQVIQKERVVCDLQQRLMSLSRLDGPVSSGHMITLPEAREEEPDDEKSPRSDGDSLQRQSTPRASLTGPPGAEGAFGAQAPRWGNPHSFQPVGHQPPLVAPSPVLNYRTTTYAPAAGSAGEGPAAVVSAGPMSGSAFRTRTYLQKSAGGYVVADGRTSSGTSPTGRERHAQRLFLSSRTFT